MSQAIPNARERRLALTSLTSDILVFQELGVTEKKKKKMVTAASCVATADGKKKRKYRKSKNNKTKSNGKLLDVCM